MDYCRIFENYKEVASYLDDVPTKTLLDVFAHQMTEREFILPFIGQYSAGKSKLINHILGRDILPTKRTETTAFPTYIKYGENDMALLTREDETTEEVSFTDVKELNYKTTKDMKNPIVGLTIYVNNPILSTGLIIVDTPGVNTLISKHVNMTEELLENSMYVVYVFPGALTKQDLLMIEKIDSLNISCVFVRTNADMIKEGEEDISATLLKEGEYLNNKLGKSVPYFAITNEENCSHHDLLDMNFQFFVDFLKKGIVDDIDDNYKNAITVRIEGIKKKLEKTIDDKISLLKTTRTESEEKLNKRSNEIKIAKDKLNKALVLNKEQVKRNEANILESINECISSKYETCLRNFKNAIAKSTYKSSKEASIEYQRLLSDSITYLSTEVSKKIEEYADKSVKSVNDELSEFVNDLQQRSGIVMDIKFDMNTVGEVEQKQKLLEQEFNDKFVRLMKLNESSDEKLSELGVKRSELDKVITEFNSTIDECHKAQKEIENSYEEHYVDVPSRYSKILKHIGTACDLALLVIPASGFASGAKLAASGAQKLSKGNKLLQLGSKALTHVEKGLKVLQQTDRIKDTATLIKSATSVVNGQGAKRINKKGNILDYLSVSYWFEKAGEIIDPSTRRLDTEYEEAFNQTKEKIQIELQNKVQERLFELHRKGLLKSEADILLKRKEMLQEEQMNLEQHFKREKQKIERQKADRMQEIFRDNMITKFVEKLCEFRKILFNKSNEVVKEMRVSILETANHVTLEKLSDIENQLSEIIKNRKDCVEDNINEINNLTVLKEKLTIE